MTPAPSLRALARSLGLSPGTVSKALRGQPGASAATVARVQAAAQSLGWRPDPLLALQGHVRQAGSRRSALIAVVSLRAELTRSQRLAQVLAHSAQNLGYQLRVCAPAELAHFRALGVLADGPGEHPALGAVGLPMVQVGGSGTLACPRVTFDALSGVRLAIARLRERGCQRIVAALGSHSPSIHDDHTRVAGALLELPLACIWRGPLHDLRALATWLAAAEPDGVVFFGPWQQQALPRPLPWVALNVPEHDSHSSGLRAQGTECAEVALAWLDRLIRWRHDAPFHPVQDIMLRPQWVEGTGLG